MKIDSTTDLAELIHAVQYSGSTFGAALEELARRSRDAERYARLTRALHELLNERLGSIHSDAERDGVWIGEDFGGGTQSEFNEHDGTPDGLADAIIAAAEEAKS